MVMARIVLRVARMAALIRWRRVARGAGSDLAAKV